MPWVVVPKPRRKPRAVGRWRAVDPARRQTWAAAGLALLILLGFWFAVASRVAGGA